MVANISVIVPVFNAGIHLKGCIQALLSQSYPEDRYQVIMVDNNSTDGSLEIIKQFPRINLEIEQQQGAYSARNRGIRRAEGTVLAFTDSDCIPDVNWLRNIAAAFEDKAKNIILGRNTLIGDSKTLAMLEAYEAEKALFVLSSEKSQIYYGYTNNMAVRADVLNRIGNFEEIPRGADVILVRRAADNYTCETVCYTPDVRVKHMEISGLKDYYRKQYIYGKSFKNYCRICSVKSLSTAERIQIFNAARKKNHYSPAESFRFLSVLLLGALYYEIGRI